MNSDTLVADIVLDTRGLSCPMPLLKTKKTLSAMAPGEVLEVIATDPGSQKDIPRFGNKGPNEFIDMVRADNGEFKFYIRKG